MNNSSHSETSKFNWIIRLQRSSRCSASSSLNYPLEKECAIWSSSFSIIYIYMYIYTYKKTGTASWTNHSKEKHFLLASTSAQWQWSFQKLTLLEIFSICRWWTTWPLFPHVAGCTHNLDSLSISLQRKPTYSHAKKKALEMSCWEICWWHCSYSVVVLNTWWFFLVQHALLEGDQ